VKEGKKKKGGKGKGRQMAMMMQVSVYLHYKRSSPVASEKEGGGEERRERGSPVSFCIRWVEVATVRPGKGKGRKRKGRKKGIGLRTHFR